MTITMSDKSHTDLIAAVHAFVDTSTSRKCPLVEWQRILGWINWGLNAYPLLCPALQPTYDKIASKWVAHALIYLNHAVLRHFCLLVDTIACSDIHLLTAADWHAHKANVIIHCDASLNGLGFVITQSQLGFCAPPDVPLNTIFFYEALCIVSAIL